jgi:hypothetical protein
MNVSLLQKPAGRLVDSYQPHKIIILNYLTGKLARRLVKQSAQGGCEQGLVLPAEGGDQII